MDKKIENHEYNLRQFIDIAIRWNINGIYKSQTSNSPFGIMDYYVINARSFFEDFRNQLRLEFDKQENEKGFEIDIKDRFLIGIKDYKNWYIDKETEINKLFGETNLYSSMLEIMLSTEREINKYYPSRIEQEEVLTNQYPRIFKNAKGFSLFNSLHEAYKSETNVVANYSFVFLALEHDEFIHCGGTEFIKFLSKNFDIQINRIDSRQSGTNKRTNLYESFKD